MAKPCEHLQDLTAVDFPPAQRLEGVVIESKDPPRTVAVGRAQSAHVNAVGTAMQRMRAAVAGAIGQSLRLDDFHNFRLLGIWFGVEYVNP